MNADPIQGLSELLERAGLAHHEAFSSTNGDDPDWPRWYAIWLVPRIAEFVDELPPIDVLATELKVLEDERQRRASDANWPEYYAKRLLDRHGSTTRFSRSS